MKGSKQLKLDPSIYDVILKQKVEVGDVIYIEANSGAVKVIFQFKSGFQFRRLWDIIVRVSHGVENYWNQ